MDGFLLSRMKFISTVTNKIVAENFGKAYRTNYHRVQTCGTVLKL
jgi:hypothetical protein